MLGQWLWRWPGCCRRVAGAVCGALLLVGFQQAGEALALALAWPLPGPVLGMLLLWAALGLLGRVPAGLGLVAALLLAHLMLPLVPAVAGIAGQTSILRQHGIALLILCVCGTVATSLSAVAAYRLVDRYRA